MLVYISQKQGTDHDWERAEAVINDAGWSEIEFSKAGTLSSENLNGKDQVFMECYEDALSNGSAILIYTQVENDGV